MKVKDPEGRTWRVSRRWVPWRRRWKGWTEALPDGPSGLGDDPIGLILGALFLILILPFLFLALISLLELLALMLVFPFALLARIVFGTHWVVEARGPQHAVWEEEAGRWRESRAAIETRAREIAEGRDLPEDGWFTRPDEA